MHTRITEQTRVEDLEFTVRVVSALKRSGCVTVADVRAKLPILARLPRMGRKGVDEVNTFFRWFDASVNDMLESDEFRRYKLEDAVTSVESMLQDVQRKLTRAAMKGAVSQDTSAQLSRQLILAADKVLEIPLYKTGE